MDKNHYLYEVYQKVKVEHKGPNETVIKPDNGILINLDIHDRDTDKTISLKEVEWADIVSSIETINNKVISIGAHCAGKPYPDFHSYVCKEEVYIYRVGMEHNIASIRIEL